MKMKVLHVAETIKGGVASVLKQLIKESGEYSILSIVPDSQIVEMADVPVDVIRTFKRDGRNFKSFISLFTTFRKAVREFRPDVIHIHSSFAGVVCRVALLTMSGKENEKVKVVYCPHAFSFLMDVSRTKKKIYSYIERFLSIKTDVIVCTSEYERNTALEYGLNGSKLRVVYNGIHEPLKEELGEISPYDNEKINVLFVGRFDYQKGIDVLFNIIKSVGPEFHFTLVGESVHDDFKKLEMQMVTYTGWVDPSQLAKYYRHADVTLMPSRWESFGLVAAESNSYGTPVIASDATALPEVVSNNVSGFLFDIADYKEAVTILNSKNKKDWLLMENDCYKNYIEKFQSIKMTQKVSAIYKE